MRPLSTTFAALAVSALVGVASPSQANLIVFNDVIDGGVGGKTITAPGGSFSFTHSITAVFNPATDTIIGGTLTIILSDPVGGIANALVTFDSGIPVDLGDVPTSPPTSNYVFNVNGTLYGTVNLLTDLQDDGKLDVELTISGVAGSTYIFNSSTLSGTADVTAVPEPSSLFLLGAGLLGFAAIRRRRGQNGAA